MELLIALIILALFIAIGLGFRYMKNTPTTTNECDKLKWKDRILNSQLTVGQLNQKLGSLKNLTDKVDVDRLILEIEVGILALAKEKLVVENLSEVNELLNIHDKFFNKNIIKEEDYGELPENIESGDKVSITKRDNTTYEGIYCGMKDGYCIIGSEKDNFCIKEFTDVVSINQHECKSFRFVKPKYIKKI